MKISPTFLQRIVMVAGILAAPALIPPLAQKPAVWAQEKAVPIESLKPAPESAVPFERWETSGGGQNTPGLPGFVQGGAKPFEARLALPDDVRYRLSGEILLPVHDAGLSITAGVPEQPAVRVSATSLSASVSRVREELRAGAIPLALPNNQDANTTWVPLSVMGMNGTVQIEIGGVRQEKAIPRGGTLLLSLRGGAQLRNLQVKTATASRLLLPLSLESTANARVAGAGADLGQGVALEANALPQGLVSSGEIPFLLNSDGKNQGLDVKTSLAGWRDDKVRSVRNYLRAGTKNRGKILTPEFGRILLDVPTLRYSAVHFLAFSRDGGDTVPRMTVRLGTMSAGAGILEDQIVNVPLWDGNGAGEYVVSRTPVKMAGGKSGFLYHLRVPMPQSANLSGLVAANRPLQLELTRDLRVRVPVPDPFEFGVIPAGPPSGVVVLAATMERTPVEMEYSTAEAGNIFHDTQQVVFQAKLTNQSAKPVSGRVFVEANGPGTALETAVAKKEWKAAAEYSLQPGESKTVPLNVTPNKRGWFRATVGLEAGGELVQRRDTSFAVLAPDTRKAMEDSPFGVWSFWDAHSATSDPNRADKLGSMILKGGWRWTYGGNPAGRNVGPEESAAVLRELNRKYKLRLTIQSPPESYQRGEGWWNAEEFQKKVVPWLAQAKDRQYDNHYKVLHESRSSTTLLRRFSPHLGGEPYDMPAAEQALADKQFANVKKYAEALKKADPTAKIVLINDYAIVAEQYLKRGFPKELFDAIGLESANFMREPERQPDWLSMLGTMAQIKRIQAKYGYDKPVWTTEALYHATNPGNLDPHQQGVISVREAMLALANGVARMAAAGLIADSADDYYWSNWGGAGFAERDPEYNPKPSYAMYAWLTQVLDQAKYTSHLNTGSNALHVLAFQKPDGAHVYPVWAVRGRQSVTLQTEGGTPVVYDVYGNPLEVPAQAGRITLDVTDTPLYVTGTTVTGVAARTPVEVPHELGKVVLEFDQPSQVKPLQQPSKVLAANWATPYLAGDFATSYVQEDGTSALRLELKDDNDARKLLPRYVQLGLDQPIELKGLRPAYLTVRAKGNGGWGRVMFECVDAAGRVWTSSGNQLPGATNAADSEGESFVSFDGWQTIKMPLPGQYQSSDQFVHWPRNFDWWPSGPVVDKALADETARSATAATEAEKDAATATAAAKTARAQAEAAVTASAAATAAATEAKAALAKDKTNEILGAAAKAASAKATAALAESTALGRTAATREAQAAEAAQKVAAAKRPVTADGHDVVSYPVKLTKVIVSMQPNILYVNDEIPVKNRVIFLDKIGVIDAPPGM